MLVMPMRKRRLSVLQSGEVKAQSQGTGPNRWNIQVFINTTNRMYPAVGWLEVM